MKKIFFAFFLLSGFFLQKTEAQVRVGVNINIGTQPDWGPYGYDNAQYYYFPDIDIYYDVINSEFVYYDGYDWQLSSYLPSAYSNFDLYGAYKVVINEPRPYLRADYYRKQYYSYRGYHNQPVLRDYRGGYTARGNDRFPQRSEPRFEQRDQRFDDRNRTERDNRNFTQRDDRNNGFDQRNREDNHNGFEQRNNDFKRGGFDQRRTEPNRGEGMNAGSRGGFGQRTESRGFGRH